MSRLVLTDRFIRSRKSAPPGKRTDHFDALVPGLGLRVTSNGHKSFVLLARFPKRPKNTTRRALGDYGAVTLDDARKKARAWLEMISKGIDPQVEAAKEQAAAHAKTSNTFRAMAEEYMRRPGSKLAKKDEIGRIITKNFVKRWGDRQASDVKASEITDVIKTIVDRGAPYQARHAFAAIRRVYNWAIAVREFGIEQSPVAGLRPTDLIGAAAARERVLTNDEIKSVWGACDGLGYPYGPLTRLLLLVGQRESEVSDASWSEIDLEGRLWTIPAHRMKSRRVQTVPLADDALALLRALPRFEGDFLFTTTGGKKPVNGFSKAKVRMDKLSGVKGWRFHDLRRTMRTHLSALPVQDMVRELVIAHARPGLHKVYDQHTYLDEKRECLELWEKRLRGLVTERK